MMNAVVTPESIKLQLVRSQQLPAGRPGDDDALLTQEAIRNAIRALEYADTELARDIETFLTHAGARAQEETLRGLLSSHPSVRAVCAMALIRSGSSSLLALNAFSRRHGRREDLRWVFDFIRDELGVTR